MKKLKILYKEGIRRGECFLAFSLTVGADHGKK